MGYDTWINHKSPVDWNLVFLQIIFISIQIKWIHIEMCGMLGCITYKIKDLYGNPMQPIENPIDLLRKPSLQPKIKEKKEAKKRNYIITYTYTHTSLPLRRGMCVYTYIYFTIQEYLEWYSCIVLYDII